MKFQSLFSISYFWNEEYRDEESLENEKISLDNMYVKDQGVLKIYITEK